MSECVMPCCCAELRVAKARTNSEAKRDKDAKIPAILSLSGKNIFAFHKISCEAQLGAKETAGCGRAVRGGGG